MYVAKEDLTIIFIKRKNYKYNAIVRKKFSSTFSKHLQRVCLKHCFPTFFSPFHNPRVNISPFTLTRIE